MLSLQDSALLPPCSGFGRLRLLRCVGLHGARGGAAAALPACLLRRGEETVEYCMARPRRVVASAFYMWRRGNGRPGRLSLTALEAKGPGREREEGRRRPCPLSVLPTPWMSLRLSACVRMHGNSFLPHGCLWLCTAHASLLAACLLPAFVSYSISSNFYNRFCSS